VTVTSLDAPADLAADEARAALPELVIDQVKFTAAALAGTLHGGDGDDPEVVRSLTFGRSYAELHALVLLLADCADTVKVARACGINPGLAAGNAKRMAEARHAAAEYAHLRDGGVIPEAAARRVGLKPGPRHGEYETAYRAARKTQREDGEAA
jgi:hypothetical protein